MVGTSNSLMRIGKPIGSIAWATLMILVCLQLPQGSAVAQSADDTWLNNTELVVNQLPSRTPNQFQYITGSARPFATVEATNQSGLITTTQANEDGDFVMLLWLEVGSNTIRFHEIVGGRRSVQVREAQIGLDPLSNRRYLPYWNDLDSNVHLEAPHLFVSDYDELHNPIEIQGTALPDSEAQIFVNGEFVDTAMVDEDGYFESSVPLSGGENSIYAVIEVEGSASPVSTTLKIRHTAGSRGQCDNNNLSGDITENTTWTLDCSPYVVSGFLRIAEGVTLWVNQGVEVRFGVSTQLRVNGELRVQGSSFNSVRFRSAGSGNPGSWNGIDVRAPGSISINHLEIRHASNAFGFRDAGLNVGSINNSLITDNSSGIYIRGSADPSIYNSRIIDNAFDGIFVDGNGANPAPLVQWSSIHSNGIQANRNYEAQGFGGGSAVTLLAKNNWWGSADPWQFLSGITSVTTIGTVPGYPYVDFTEWLTSEGGSPTSSQAHLYGGIHSDTTFNQGDHYFFDTINVENNATLTLGPGAVLHIHKFSELNVDGSLVLAGTESQPAMVRPLNPSCPSSVPRNDWAGIDVKSGGFVGIDYGEVLCAESGITFRRNADGLITRSKIHQNHNGIRFHSAGGASSTAPQIRDNNEIVVNLKGIRIFGDVSPQIFDSNFIFYNQYGIYVEGSGFSADNPSPVVYGNSIYNNTWNGGQYNYYATNFGLPDTTILLAQGNWWGTADPDEVREGIYDRQSNSGSPIVHTWGFLDGPGGEEALVLYDVELQGRELNVAELDTTLVSFVANTQSVVVLQIVDDSDGELAYYSSQVLPAGEHTLYWVGEGMGGGFVDDGVYKARLLAQRLDEKFTYDPQERSDPGTISVDRPQLPSSVAPFRNESFKYLMTLTEDVMVSTLISPSNNVSDPFMLLERDFFAQGDHWVVWDMRNDLGEILTGSFNVNSYTQLLGMPELAIIVTSQPRVTGLDEIPNIEVKSDPYLVVHAYEQISRIAFRVDVDSYVSVKLLPPGVYDPSHADAIVVVEDEFMPAVDSEGAPIDHVAEWRGYNTASVSQILTSEEGAFTFSIEAEGDVSGRVGLYRGVLNLRR